MERRCGIAPLVITALSTLLILLFIFGKSHGAESVFDKRDPDVIRAEGFVEGLFGDQEKNVTGTLWFMRDFERAAGVWSLQHSEVASANPLRDYGEKIDAVAARVAELRIHPEFKKTMTLQHPVMGRLSHALAEATDAMFRLVHLMMLVDSRL